MGGLQFEIDHEHEHNGWIDCYLSFNDVRHHIDASGALPPFLPFLYFLKRIAGGKLPAKCHWDEEGVWAKFTATPIENSDKLVHLTVQHTDADEPWVDADLDRMEIVQAFLPALRSCSRSKSGPGWELPAFTVESVEQAIEQGTLFSESESIVRKVNFLMVGIGYDVEELTSATALQIWLEDDFITRWNLMDTSVFWPRWFEFLEKVAKLDLPATFSFTPERIQNTWLASLGLEIIEEISKKEEYSFYCAAGADSTYVQFEWKGIGGDRTYPDMNIRINPRQLVQTFCDTFEDFLETNYKMSVDEQGNTFDLRKLPLDRVRDALNGY
jgi:hypothetical protein